MTLTALTMPTGELPRVTRQLPPARYGLDTIPAKVQTPADGGRALVTMAQSDDPVAVARALGELYRIYYPGVFRFIIFRVKQRPLAEDLTSDVFVRMCRNIRTWSYTGTDFAAWLTTVARNRVADHFKAGWTKHQVVSDDVVSDRLDVTPATDPGEQPEAAVLAHATSARLAAALDKLLPDQRECVSLRFLGGLSTMETAAVMGRNEGAIKALQYRACRALARLLEGEEI